MPNGLPAATVTITSVNAEREDGGKMFVPYQAHVEPICRGADQDGWNGEIICRYKETFVAIPQRALRLE